MVRISIRDLFWSISLPAIIPDIAEHMRAIENPIESVSMDHPKFEFHSKRAAGNR